jgi:hypothetical protein
MSIKNETKKGDKIIFDGGAQGCLKSAIKNGLGYGQIYTVNWIDSCDEKSVRYLGVKEIAFSFPISLFSNYSEQVPVPVPVQECIVMKTLLESLVHEVKEKNYKYAKTLIDCIACLDKW